MVYQEKVLEELNKLDFKSVLDCGCGNRWLEKHVEGYEGFDLPTDLNGELPYEDNSFDLVITCAVLSTIKDISKAVQNIKRIAKKYIVLVEFQGEPKDYTTGQPTPTYNTTRIMRNYEKEFGLEFEMINIPKSVWPGDGWQGEDPGKILICRK